MAGRSIPPWQSQGRKPALVLDHMANEGKPLEKVILSRLIRLNAKIQGVVTGLVFGAVVFVSTNWLLLKGGPIGPDGQPVIGPHLALLRHFFIGYRVTFLGSLIGFAYAFAVGFVIGYFVARTYNWVVSLRQPRG